MPRKTAALPDPSPTDETAAASVPGIMPQGVDAQVETKIKYNRRIEPDDNGAAGFRRERADDDYLAQLAAEEADNLSPPDPLAAFLEEWSHYAGYNCVIVRQPDPAARRMFGNGYARPCFELERIGDTPFDPVNFVSMLQMFNGNSGGVFRVWLTDAAGNMIPGARLDRFAIADPPRGGGGAPAQPAYGSQIASTQNYDQARPPSPSVIERKMADLQTRLLETALERALNPAPIAPVNVMPDEDRLALLLLREGNLLSTVVQRIAAVAQAPETIERATWKDKLMDVASQNPQIVARVSDTLERIVARILPAPEAPRQVTQHAPQATPAAQAQAANYPAEVPATDDESEDEDMAIIDEVLALLNSSKPLTQEDPIFVTLQTEHPIKFPLFVRMIASAPLETVIAFLKSQNSLYNSLLTDPASGPRLTARVSELQALCIAAIKAAQAQATPETTEGK